MTHRVFHCSDGCDFRVARFEDRQLLLGVHCHTTPSDRAEEVCLIWEMARKAVLYLFTLVGPRTRDRELLCDRAHARAAWAGVQLLKVIMVMVKEQNFITCSVVSRFVVPFTCFPCPNSISVFCATHDGRPFKIRLWLSSLACVC